MALFTLDTSDIDRMEKDLKLFNARALPYATRQTLTGAAFAARTNWQGEIDDKLVTRNQYTRRSVRVEQARSLKISAQRSVVGSIADYMDITEEGGTESGRSGNKAIPTGYAAGQKGQRPRTRVPLRRNRMQNIRITSAPNRQFANKRQEILVKILMAARQGARYIFLETPTTRGIFEIKGKARTRNGRLTGVRVMMVQNLKNRSVRIEATPTLQPALTETRGEVDAIYRKALAFQLRRHNILGY